LTPTDPPPIGDARDAFGPGEPDPDAEAAFIEARRSLILSDPSLTDEEKQAALAELESKLRRGR
jgi:hypothetical protein